MPVNILNGNILYFVSFFSCMQNESRVAENLFSVHQDKEKGTPLFMPKLKVSERIRYLYVLLFLGSNVILILQEIFISVSKFLCRSPF